MYAVARGVADSLAVYAGVDVARARSQHRAYVDALRELGVDVAVLPADPALADCCFVEDTGVVDGERALLTRMGFPERRPETAAIRDALAGFALTEMAAPATLDGGDVLRLGDRVYAGRSARTNDAGIAALRDFLGRDVTPVPVRDCLHLKTACTEVAPGVVLVNPAWVAPPPGVEALEAPDPNALRIGGTCLVSHPAAEDALKARGIPVRRLDISEFARADGGLTCLSLLLERPPGKNV